MDSERIDVNSPQLAHNFAPNADSVGFASLLLLRTTKIAMMLHYLVNKPAMCCNYKCEFIKKFLSYF